ncbi:hypothetical protein HJG60_011529 [Phyllostomus discolor]|uniref:Integrase catalytic domain-containing protein n=1 Tax=Phyllostomus discolor TaxID=89673 RepID=A0A833ZVZ1_9CHIR|nr:hypothetical protein HJG60_011529 [Phyllostomus discolor]
MKHLHEATHYVRDLLTMYIKLWLTNLGLSKAIRKVIARCVVCQKNTPRQIPAIPRTMPTSRLANKLYPDAKGQKVEIFVSLVATFSGWVDVYPTKTEKSSEVVKALLKEIVPCSGLPCSIQSDNGPAFV